MFEEAHSKPFQNIHVFVRIRPFFESELSIVPFVNVSNDQQLSIKTKDESETKFYSFDKVFKMDSTQKMVYDSVTEGILDKSFEGINSTIFCYGQTTSGKTHTCIGPDFHSEEKKGILPRIIEDALAKIQTLPKNIQAKIKISLIEIYNEKIKDLLNPLKQSLKIRQSKSQGIFLADVTEKYIFGKEEAIAYMTKGMSHRSVGSTLSNKKSSRSHMMFIITIHQHNVYSGEAVSAKIIVADLAGSEKYVRMGIEEKFQQETKKINTSLSSLSKVISVLSEGRRCNHIPYRDSKLTRLLQESLGGNTTTKLIINLSPSSSYQYETIMSLRFGTRAKLIKNEPKINKEYTVVELLKILAKAEQKIKEQSQIINQYKLKNKGGELTNILGSGYQLSRGVSEILDEGVEYKSQSLNFAYQEDPEISQNLKNDQSTKSIQDWEGTIKRSPLKPSFSDKKLVSPMASTPILRRSKKSLLSLNSTSVQKRKKQSIRKYEEIQNFKEQSDRSQKKNLEFASRIYSMKLFFNDDAQKVKEEAETQANKGIKSKSEITEDEEKKDTKKFMNNKFSLEENLRYIRKNLQRIKEKHLKHRQYIIRK